MAVKSSKQRPPQTLTEALAKKSQKSAAVEALLFQLKVAGLPTPQLELTFHGTRRWRFDLAYIPSLIAIEVDGGGWMKAKDGQGGRHSRGQGIENDCEKYAEAMKLGWRVLRVTPKHVKSGQALAWIQELLK
jgi:hypothetical protein